MFKYIDCADFGTFTGDVVSGESNLLSLASTNWKFGIKYIGSELKKKKKKLVRVVLGLINLIET